MCCPRDYHRLQHNPGFSSRNNRGAQTVSNIFTLVPPTHLLTGNRTDGLSEMSDEEQERTALLQRRLKPLRNKRKLVYLCVTGGCLFTVNNTACSQTLFI